MSSSNALSFGPQLATHLREVHLGGNWCEAHYKGILSDLSLDEAKDKSFTNNSILTLCYHTHYYVKAMADVLEGKSLTSKDAESFLVPEITTAQDWQNFIEQILQTADRAAGLLEKCSNERLNEFFGNEKYGSIFRNVFGIIEHLNYHLGQIVLIKKHLRHKTAAG